MEEDLKKSKKSESTKRLELCMIFTVLLVGIALAITLIVYFAENKPEKSPYIKEDATVQKTPYAAVKSGVEWLRGQQHDYMWPSGQSADAVLAMKLGRMSEFSNDNCEFRLAAKSAEFDLLTAMLTDNTLSGAEWGRGALAKYIVALRTVCMDVTMFHNSNLITLLRNQYTSYQNYYNGDRRALAWYTLAHCTAGQNPEADIVNRLVATPGTYSMGVEEAAMVAIALSCVNATSYSTQIMAAHTYIIGRRNMADNTFGNEYETALALQALTNANLTNLAEIKEGALDYLTNLIQVTYNGQYKNLAAASHIMPALAGKSFADAKMECPEMMTTTPAAGQAIQITIRVKGGVLNSSVDQSLQISITNGQSLHRAMVLLQGSSNMFMFSATNTARGSVLQSVMGLALEPNSLQYWKIMEGNTDVTSTGIDYIMPSANQVYTIEAA